MAEKQKLHEPVLDHNGNPFSPAQILALERAELTRLRFKRDAMILAERREQLIEMSVVNRQAAALFAACRQKLLSIPHTLSHRLVGKDHRTIHDAITSEIHKALREMADFDQKVIKPEWQAGSSDDPFRQSTRPLPKARPVIRKRKSTLQACLRTYPAILTLSLKNRADEHQGNRSKHPKGERSSRRSG